MRAALGSCLFKLKRYGESVAILKPMEIEINANPQLDYVYSVSLVKSGAIAAGMTRLQSMASVMPRLFDVHVALADAYSLQGDHQNAARELGIAVQLNPSDVDAQHKLASESAIH